MRTAALVFAVALAALLTAGAAGAKDNPHAYAYSTETAGVQMEDAQGNPVGPPQTIGDGDSQRVLSLGERDNAPVSEVRRVNAAAGCQDVWAERQGHSTVFGTLLWRFRHGANNCWNSSNTIVGLTRYQQPIPVDPTWFFVTGSLVEYLNPGWYVWCCGIAHSGHSKYKSVRFVQKLNGTVIANKAPWVTLRVNGAGRFDASNYDTGTN